MKSQKPGAAGKGGQTTRWSGKVKHRLGSSTVELFYLSALIPDDLLEQMPPTLFVTELAQVSCSDVAAAVVLSF